MKTTPKISIGILIAFVAYIFLIPMRSDNRLSGTFAPDVEATNQKWRPLDDTTLQDTANILAQIFGEAPIRFTNRTMTMRDQPDQLVKRYWVLWRGEQTTHIFVMPFTFFRVEHEDNGFWLKILPEDDKLLYVKLKRIEVPTTSLRDAAETPRP